MDHVYRGYPVSGFPRDCQSQQGGRLWFIVDYCLTPCGASTIDCVAVAIGQRPQGMQLLVSRDFNTNSSNLDGHVIDEDIYTAMATEGLEDMADYLLPRHLPWKIDGQTWNILYCRKEVRPQKDYILRTDHRLFQNVAAQEPRHNTDHYLILGFLCGTTLRDHQRYLISRILILFHTPRRTSLEYTLFAELCRVASKPP